MSGDDVSLALRRARRSSAKRIDLSDRGLRTWPLELFNLDSLTEINLSGNQLTNVPTTLTQLQSLRELNLANNQIGKVPDVRFDMLSDFESLMLEGNPIAAQLGLNTVRQLSHPPRAAGRSPGQVIQGLLNSVPSASSAPPRGSRVAVKEQDDVTEITEVDGYDSDSFCSDDSQGGGDAGGVAQAQESQWQREKIAMRKEIQRLQGRVEELEAELETSKRGTSAAPAKPSWLQDSRTSQLSATLPSRMSSAKRDDEADDLKSQLRDEQRKNKRLETDMQKLQARLRERPSSTGSGSTALAFELSDLDIGDQISQGGFSLVHRGVWNTTKVAVKQLFDPTMSEANFAEFDNEVQKLEAVRHPNILALLAVHRKPPKLAMITELVEGGSLFELIHSPQKFNTAVGSVENLAYKRMLDILDPSAVAIAFLHACNIIHRDVKTHNVLLTPYLEVKLCDFGLARMRSELMTGVMQFAGTPNYMAPEIFENRKYTDRVDVFAFGTLLWEAMALDIPFANFDPPEIKSKVCSGDMPALPSGVPLPMRHLITACWALDQGARPSMAEVQRQLVEIRSGGGGGRSGSAHRRRPQTAKLRDDPMPVGTVGLGGAGGGFGSSIYGGSTAGSRALR